MQVNDYNKIREIASEQHFAESFQKKRLSSMREILDGRVSDLVSDTPQKASLAPDGKRLYSANSLFFFASGISIV